MQYKRPESVLVVIYTEDNQVLMLERKQPIGYWQSVTGSLKVDEDAKAAACREVAEETGYESIDLIDTGVINHFPILPEWRSRYAPEVKENTEYVFALQVAKIFPVRLNPDEHISKDWLSREAAAQIASSWTNRDAILGIVAPS